MVGVKERKLGMPIFSCCEDSHWWLGDQTLEPGFISSSAIMHRELFRTEPDIYMGSGDGS